MTRTVEEVFDEIKTWGDPAEEFRRRGIKGIPENACECPFARFIKQETGVEDINVSNNDTIIGPEGGEQVWFINPDNMFEFIQEFDEGEYPELIEGASER